MWVIVNKQKLNGLDVPRRTRGRAAKSLILEGQQTKNAEGITVLGVASCRQKAHKAAIASDFTPCPASFA
ncbi:hypothetical protein QFZ30_002232 [Arthrobacter pascens]|nr:hypothetical protein [Arthrobacter pascens]